MRACVSENAADASAASAYVNERHMVHTEKIWCLLTKRVSWEKQPCNDDDCLGGLRMAWWDMSGP